MPLIPIVLEKGLLDMMIDKPTSPQEAARRMADVYARYARFAVAGGPASFTGLEARQMERRLVGGFRNPESGNPSRGGGGIIGGIQAFWLTPPVVFGAFTASFFAGAPVLGSCLGSSFRNPRIPVGLAAKKLANCLDKATRTVFAVGVGPPVPVS